MYRGEPISGVLPHLFPHVQYRSAGGIDQRTSLAIVPFELRNRHAERGENDDGLVAEPVRPLTRIAQETDARGAQLLIHVRVVNDLAREVDRPVREPSACLIGVIDRPIHTVAEPELPREVDGQPPGRVPVCRSLDPVDELAVVVLGQLAGDHGLEIESLSEDQ